MTHDELAARIRAISAETERWYAEENDRRAAALEASRRAFEKRTAIARSFRVLVCSWCDYAHAGGPENCPEGA